ncbi:uncharacterized protein LOC113295015 [Papaver somniferum]|uniref:uncharacterized protein LOC113295015 n=1 Tax=Papaver somniferum TaxID=3469 RepID=UPI000E6F7B77|nr:uncharacterized protein LOC113295015 [Papaver somniferum]
MKRKRKKDKWGVMGLKLDMSKAFDIVKWGFLGDILKAFGFSEHWCDLIYQCISTSSISIMLNGSPCKSYRPTRGLRQGDPLSPYLFIICMETFSRYLLQAEQNNLIHGVKAGRSVMVQHVLKSSPIYHMNTFTIPDNIINSMESSQRDFWWGKSRPGDIYFRAWPRICTHKQQGGLGFRNLKYMNLPLLSKTTWKLIHNPNALWVIILRYKYFRNVHPLHHPRKTDCSWAWQSISRGLDFIAQNDVWEVKNGKNILAFEDKWLSSPVELVRKTRPNPNLTVSALIDEDTKNWITDLVHAFFTPQNAKNILEFRISFSGNDKLIWPYSKNGDFSVKSAYKVISGEINYMNNSQVGNPFYKTLWKLSILSKVALFIWKCHEKIIPSNFVLARYNNTHDAYCSTCNNGQIETLNTLSSSWTTDCTMKDKICDVFTIAWSIWKDRCFHIFQGKTLNHYSTARLALKLVTDTDNYLRNVSAQHVQSNDPVAEINLSSVNTVMAYLPQDCVIIFSDAAFDKDTKTSGIGLILTDNSCSFIGCKLKAGSVRNVEEAETLALLEAVQWAKAKSLEKVCFISDVKLVIESLNSLSNQLYWYNKTVIED